MRHIRRGLRAGCGLVLCTAISLGVVGSAGRVAAESADLVAVADRAGAERVGTDGSEAGRSGAERSGNERSGNDQSTGLRAVAERARTLRREIREDLAASVDSRATGSRDALRARLVETGRAALALEAEPALARVLLHLFHSWRALDRAAEQPGPHAASRPTESLAATHRATTPEATTRQAATTQAATKEAATKEAAEQAARWLARAASLAAEQGDLALAGHARVRLAELYAEASRDDEAMILARRGALEAAEASHADSLYRAHWLMARLHRRGQRDARALAAYRAAVATLESMKVEIANRAADEAFSFRLEVEPVYRGLVDLLLVSARAVGPVDPALAQERLREARNVIEWSRQAELRDYFEDECLPTGSASAADERLGAVVVYPIALDDRVEIVVGRDGRLSSHVAPIDAAELARLADDLRRRLEDRRTRRYLPRAQAMYDVLVRPIESRLREGAVTALVFVPSGPLRQLPLAALHDRESGRFLVEDYPIAMLPALTLTTLRPVPRVRVELLAAGLSKAVEDFPALPHVAGELAAVHGRFPGTVLMDEDFVASRLDRTLATAPYDILHLATHGRFSPRAEDSYILAWDGPLSLERLARMLGRARFRSDRPIELLVLSACETAAGDERSALGLAGAALRMGARSVVATLWSVNDEASSRLVDRFYEELADPAHSRASALQAAQIWMLREAGYAHPVDWSAFVLINSWL